MTLQGKVAMVTGASQGIGFAIADHLASLGARVAIADIDISKGNEASAKINAARGEGSAIAIKTDVSIRESVFAAVDTIVKTYGGVDILVCNAAIWKQLERRPFWEIPDAEWDQVLAVNTRGPFLCCAAVAPIMRANRRGKIIFIGSATIATAQATLTHYVASKAALIGLMRCVAREMGAFDVCVNMLHPGLTDSGGVDRAVLEDRAKKKLIARVGMPEDLVGMVGVLAGAQSDFMTGQQIYVDGGQILN